MNQLPPTLTSQNEQEDLGQNAQNEHSTIHHHQQRGEGGDAEGNNHAEDDEDNMTEINVDDIDHENGRIVSRLERTRNTMVQNWTPVS
jgi:hypothetical protein